MKIIMNKNMKATTTEYLLAGFGGQGILFAGKFLAYLGMNEGKHVTWLPSYGPEMRGGTANCSVILSAEPIGSPIVSAPGVLAAMNLPSLDKYEKAVKAGGVAYIDSSLISRKITRSDITAVYVPATQIASDNGMLSLANMILLGKMLSGVSPGALKTALEKSVSAKRADMVELNLRALELGKRCNTNSL